MSVRVRVCACVRACVRVCIQIHRIYRNTSEVIPHATKK